jgi:hypothetical protein
MSDHPFPQQNDTSYPTLDVFPVDPNDLFQLSNVHTTSTPGSDPSPVELLAESQWELNPKPNSNSDLFPQGSLSGNPWSQQQSQSSADQFWGPYSGAHGQQSQFDTGSGWIPASTLDIPQAMASISAAAASTPARELLC